MEKPVFFAIARIWSQGYSLYMKPIRLLAMDLDDTLLRSDLSISYRTKKVVKKAVSKGIALALVSGRVPAAMGEYSRTLGMNKRRGFLVSNNGALIHESDTQKTMHEAKIAPQIALAVYDLADAEGFPVQLYESDIMYVSRQNEYSSYDQKLTGLRQEVVEDFHTLLNQGCYKLIIPGDPMLLEPLESIMRTYLENDITLFTSKPYNLEILPPDTDKGKALSMIAGLLGIEADETMAIGDSMNDEAMIRWAGMGVCMINGDDRLKSAADIVSRLSNDDDGAAEIIEKYLLGRQEKNG